jgi:hypothetical protein
MTWLVIYSIKEKLMRHDALLVVRRVTGYGVISVRIQFQMNIFITVPNIATAQLCSCLLR